MQNPSLGNLSRLLQLVMLWIISKAHGQDCEQKSTSPVVLPIGTYRFPETTCDEVLLFKLALHLKLLRLLRYCKLIPIHAFCEGVL